MKGYLWWSIKDGLARWIAYRLPRRIVYHAGARIIGNAGTQLLTPPEKIDCVEAMSVWDIHESTVAK